MDLKSFPRLTAILLAMALVCVLAPAFAAPDAQKFKVGDRVEVDTSGSHTYWKKATVIAFKENDSYNGRAKDSGYFYRVTVDSIPDAPEGYLVLAADMRLAAEVRKSQGRPSTEKAPKTDAQPPPKANAEECTPQPFPNLSGAPSESVFKAVIKGQYEKQARPGQDGKVCVTFESFQIGAAQRWNPSTDPRRVGTDRLGTKPKTIYPVKANFTVTTYYNTELAITQWTGTVFTCFKDESFGNWKCRGEQGFDWQYKSKRVPR
jgi:hypothetical protein